MSVYAIFGRLMRSFDYAYDVMHLQTNENIELYPLRELQTQVCWIVEHTQTPGVQCSSLLLESTSLAML